MAQIVLLNDINPSGMELGHPRAIGPYVLASKARRAGFTCQVIDFFTSLNHLSDILEKVIGPETLLVGISGTFLRIKTPSHKMALSYTPDYFSGYLWMETLQELSDWLQDLRSLIHRRNSRAHLVLGGAKALTSALNPEMQTVFDFYVIGKGESFFVELIQQLQKGEEPPFGTYQKARFLHEASYRKSTDSIESILWSPSDIIQKNESLPVEIAKGCLYNCKFCNFDKQGSLKQEMGLLKDHLIRNHELFGTRVYSFCDDCFNDTRAKVESFCNMFLSLPFPIEWVSYARVDVAVKFPQTLDLMIESGARGLFWGLESFDPKVARNVGKGTDPNLVKEMLLRLKNTHGDRVISTGSFIVGLPGETEESLWNTNRWLIETRALHDTAYFVLNLKPYSERLDKTVIDYADFSRNPEKYGFSKVSFNPTDWAHETMTYSRAHEIKKQLLDQLHDNGLQTTFAQSIFQYPHLRSLGLSHSEIIDIYRHHQWYGEKHQELLKIEREWRARYEEGLLNHLRIQKPQDLEL